MNNVKLETPSILFYSEVKSLRVSGEGTFLLEFITYLFIAVMLLTAAFVLVVRILAFNQQLERSVLTECALHNAITLFRRDAVNLPSNRSAYSTLLPNRISFAVPQQGTVSWYFDNNRLMRAQFEHEKKVHATHEHATHEHAVVLEPVEQGSFKPFLIGQHVRSLEISLSHNDKILNHTIWIQP